MVNNIGELFGPASLINPSREVFEGRDKSSGGLISLTPVDETLKSRHKERDNVTPRVIILLFEIVKFNFKSAFDTGVLLAEGFKLQFEITVTITMSIMHLNILHAFACIVCSVGNVSNVGNACNACTVGNVKDDT